MVSRGLNACDPGVMTYRRPNRERAFRQAKRTVASRRRPTPPYLIKNVAAQVGMSSLTAEQFVQGWGIGAAPPVDDYSTR
jgi:hypothetical protein